MRKGGILVAFRPTIARFACVPSPLNLSQVKVKASSRVSLLLLNRLAVSHARGSASIDPPRKLPLIPPGFTSAMNRRRRRRSKGRQSANARRVPGPSHLPNKIEKRINRQLE